LHSVAVWPFVELFCLRRIDSHRVSYRRFHTLLTFRSRSLLAFEGPKDRACRGGWAAFYFLCGRGGAPRAEEEIRRPPPHLDGGAWPGNRVWFPFRPPSVDSLF